MRYVAGVFLFLGSVAGAQDGNGLSQRNIDEAIRRGVAWLRTAPSTGGHLNTNCDELILLTFIHAGVSERDEHFQKLFKNVMEAPLEHTYKVALLAMCLEELDRVTFQWRIAQCAQFLVDNQCQNGQWSYGKPTEAVKNIASGDKELKPPAPTKGVREFGAEREKPKVRQRLKVSKGKPVGPASGDNSNSQYAALGLRACYDAGVDVPEETVYLAYKWWVESQHPDEGGAGKNDVASGDGGKTQGWNYRSPAVDDRKPYHAMTAGALGAVCIYNYMMGRDWKKDPVVKAGYNWLAKHFTVNSNYYYMYGLERAGMLYGTDKFGDHDWYLKGAQLLLKQQKADGSWNRGDKPEEGTWDTCFAILFLKKATRAIASEGGRRR
ncbi:MAG TPA: hypothetical protein VNO22_08345 [Planctomycetota bacterium]|jgi:hypothetical protein|nr:hypothetical protein [Planctomycetota bacterium]